MNESDELFDVQITDTTTPPAEPLPEVETVAEIVDQSIHEQQNVTPIGTGYAGDTEGNLAVESEPTWYPPEVDPIVDPSDTAPEAQHLREMVGETPAQPPTFEEQLGVDEDRFRVEMIAAGLDPDRVLASPEFWDDVYAGQVQGVQGVKRYAAGLAFEVKRSGRLKALEDSAAQFGMVQADPITVVAQRTERMEQALGQFLAHQQEQAAQQEFRSAHDEAWNGLVSELTQKGLRIPDPAQFFDAMVKTGYINFAPQQAVAATYDHLAARDPSFRSAAPATPRSDYHPTRNPRGGIVLPTAGNASTTVSPAERVRQLTGVDPFEPE